MSSRIVIFLSLVSGLLFITNTHAQAGFIEDYQGYLKTNDAYRTAHSTYITTRNQYLQYGTLNSQNEALDAVKKFLIARDEVVLSFISLLRLKNNDPLFAALLNDDENFLKNHKEKVPVVATLNDAVSVSQVVENQHILFQVTSRKIVATLLIAKVENLHLKYHQLEAKTTSLIHTLKNQGKDVTTLERWILDAKNKELLSEQKLLEAQNKTTALRSSSLDNLTQEYNAIQFTIFEANQYLREALAFTTELSENIKYGNY